MSWHRKVLLSWICWPLNVFWHLWGVMCAYRPALREFRTCKSAKQMVKLSFRHSKQVKELFWGGGSLHTVAIRCISELASNIKNIGVKRWFESYSLNVYSNMFKGEMFPSKPLKSVYGWAGGRVAINTDVLCIHSLWNRFPADMGACLYSFGVSLKPALLPSPILGTTLLPSSSPCLLKGQKQVLPRVVGCDPPLWEPLD